MSSVLATADERSSTLNRALVAAFLENIPDYVYFKDRHGAFLAMSKSLMRYFGATTSAEVLGRTDFDFIHPTDAKAAADDEQRIIRTGQSLLGKLAQQNRLNGPTTWLLTSKVPLRGENGEIIGTFGLSKDVTKTREMEAALQKAQQELIDASRTAGMAEVANGVLHNVGNVLNSLNVSASVIGNGLRMSKAESLAKIAALLREHRTHVAEFLTRDAKGKRIPEFLDSLARHAIDERDRLLQEIGSLQKNIDHIKDIVSMQQTYATTVGVVEALDPVTMMEDSIRMNAGALLRHDVQIVREFHPAPAILGEKSKVLQILINLIRNAKYACDETGQPGKLVTLRIQTAPDPHRVHLIVQDNGVGVPAENLTRIFAHGFTTRVDGHGFGLHSAANAAREMKGSITVQSDGPGKGATFVLEMPAASPSFV